MSVFWLELSVNGGRTRVNPALRLVVRHACDSYCTVWNRFRLDELSSLSSLMVPLEVCCRQSSMRVSKNWWSEWWLLMLS